jgi:hypothetical protein
MISISTAEQSCDGDRGVADQGRRLAGMFSSFGAALLGLMLFVPGIGMQAVAATQASAAAPVARQIGTVKTVNGNTLTLTSDAGQTYTVTVLETARVLQLAPGSTDLKSAQVIALTDVAVGDRILVVGKAGDTPDAFTAARVILMKSTDIAQKHAAEEEDWQKRGSGGLVSAVDPSSGTVTITARGKKVAVQTTSSTIFRRYAGDSVKFESAQKSTLTEIQVGDQLRVRGTKSDDGSSIQAEEIVSGSFRNLAGTIATIDASGMSFTIKDLATKKTYTVAVTENSNIHAIPAEMAQRFAARARGQAGQGTPAAGAAPTGRPSGAPAGASGSQEGPQAAGAGRGAGMDLSQVVSRLPMITMKDLHAGEAVMVVASQPQASGGLTAITLLSGVEPILAASPSGAAMTLSPWNMGGPGDAGVQ